MNTAHYEIVSYIDIAELVSAIGDHDLQELATDRADVSSIVTATLANAKSYAEWLGNGQSGAAPSIVALEIKVGSIIYQSSIRAEGTVNSYLSRRYSVPVQSSDGNVPWEITDCALSIARFNLYSRRPRVPEDVTRGYEYAIAWLKDVSKGVASIAALDGSGENESPASTSMRSGDSSRDSVSFSNLNL